jgi:phage terminase large subunit-like protein
MVRSLVQRTIVSRLPKFSRWLARSSKPTPNLQSIIRVIPSTKTLACYSNGSFYRAISAEAGTKHGLNPSFVIYDELAQAKNRDLYDVLDTSWALGPSRCSR